jgi:hypothetical protein
MGLPHHDLSGLAMTPAPLCNCEEGDFSLMLRNRLRNLAQYLLPRWERTKVRVIKAGINPATTFLKRPSVKWMLDVTAPRQI